MASNRIRYKRFGYLALNVSDPVRSRRYYKDIVGLQFAEQSANGDIYLRCSDFHHDLVLTASQRPGLRRIGWQMESADAFSALRESFAATGVAAVDLTPDEASELGTDGTQPAPPRVVSRLREAFSTIGAVRPSPASLKLALSVKTRAPSNAHADFSLAELGSQRLQIAEFASPTRHLVCLRCLAASSDWISV